MNEIAVMGWEDGEVVITINGNPVGQTLSQKEAEKIAAWLRTSLREIVKSIKVEVPNVR
jgi:hypothetical protein